MDGQYWKGDQTMSTNEWLLTSGFWQFLEPWPDMGVDTNTNFLLLRVQTTYMTKKMRGDFLGTRLIMLGFMDLGWPRVCRCSTSVLFIGFRPGKVLYPYAITNGGVFWLLPSLVNNNSIAALVMTSSNGNIFRVTGPLWGEFTCQRWIPHTTASDAELWCFVWFAPE